MYFLSFPIGLLFPAAVGFILATIINKARGSDPSNDSPHKIWALIGPAIFVMPYVVFYIEGVNVGASLLFNYEDGPIDILAFFGLVFFEIIFFWPIVITEGIESLLLGGYDLNGSESYKTIR